MNFGLRNEEFTGFLHLSEISQNRVIYVELSGCGGKVFGGVMNRDSFRRASAGTMWRSSSTSKSWNRTCAPGMGLGFPSSEQSFLPLAPGSHRILDGRLASGTLTGRDAHTKFFDDEVVAENIQAAVDIGEAQGQLQEQADALPSSALHDKAVPHQELQEEAQVDRKKGGHEDGQIGRYRPDAGPLLDPFLGVVPMADQNVNAPGGAETYDAHGKEKAKHLKGDEDLGAPGAIGHVVEAHVIFHFLVEVVDGDAPGPHQDPDGTAGPEDLPGGPAVADQERVLDGQEPVQADEADGEDAAVHADKVETLDQGTEGWKGSRHVVQDHPEGEGEHQQQVEDRQVDHVDGRGGILCPPLLQEGAEAADGQQVEKQAQEEGGDVDSQTRDFHQLIHVIEGARLAFVELTHVLP